MALSPDVSNVDKRTISLLHKHRKFVRSEEAFVYIEPTLKIRIKGYKVSAKTL